MSEKIAIRFGGLADSLKNQVESQGFYIDCEVSELLQEFADKVLFLRIHGILPDSQARHANKRIMRMIEDRVIKK